MSMKLTVQDLAMFIGCDVEIQHAGFPENYKQFFAKTGDVVKVEPILLLTISQGYVKVKPILRPLSDMTDQEAKECAIVLWYESEEDFNKGNEGFNQQQVLRAKLDIQDQFGGISLPTYNTGFKLFKLLISKHFDVFNWIKKGLAIDKTKGIH